MMEVARNGIFNPQAFTFADIIIIFMAVMVTDVLLLDMFNTFGLPTSTTVSVVFELLGASVGMAIVKIKSATAIGAENIGDFINSERALLIISGILLSVVIAFTVGIIVQYISRIIFSFNYRNTIKFFGPLWGGIAIAAITFFILIKGAKGSSLISSEQIAWIGDHSMLIIGISFVGWAVLLALLQWLFRINIFKIIILFGTFALAMAFAGNDLVNFIGVPLAGYESYKVFSAQQALGANEFFMTALTGAVKTPTIFLILAGIIMAVALWFSRKARTVTRTEINLGSQDLVNERFNSSAISRAIVRIGVNIGNLTDRVLPEKIQKIIASRFDDRSFKKLQKKDKSISFDLVRASVNLAVSSSLIAFATSYKLPLSTTYVTFMVAMGTSLADRAWGRESAVYRVSGVITVIGGWFFTAFCAFTASFLMALMISWGGIYAIIALVLFAGFIIYKTHGFHRKKEVESKQSEAEVLIDSIITGKTIYDKCSLRVVNSLQTVAETYKNVIDAFIDEKRKKLSKANKEVRKLNRDIKSFKSNAHDMICRLQENEPSDSGEYYVQMLDYLRETAHCMTYLSEPLYTHIDNNHESIKSAEAVDLKKYLNSFQTYINKAIKIISSKSFSEVEKLNSVMYDLLSELSKMRKSHLKRIKGDSISTRLSMLYLDILAESKNLNLFIINIVKTSRDFYASANRDKLKI